MTCGDVRVLGIVGSSDPDYSFAALAVTGEKSPLLRRRGGDVGARKVEYVARDRVYLSQGDSTCEARIFSPRDGAASAPPSAAPLAATPGIVRVSSTEVDVDRSVVERLLESPQELMNVAQIAPEKSGIRITNVRAGSPIAALGIQQGDLLQTIGGYRTSDPQQMLEAYARLGTAEKLTLLLQRSGQTLGIEYRIK